MRPSKREKKLEFFFEGKVLRERSRSLEIGRKQEEIVSKNDRNDWVLEL